MTSMLKIPMVDLVGQYNKIKPEVDSAIQEILSTAAFINGPHVTLLLAAETFSEPGPCCLTPKHVVSIPWDFYPRRLLLLKINTPKSALTSC